MRLWHLLFTTAVLALIMVLAQDAVGAVAVIVFVVGLGEVAVGTTAIMALFQTLGALGEARGLVEHTEALAATTVVLGIATAIMTGCLFVGAWLVQVIVA